MKIQIWYAESVPALVPDWVDSHITIEYDYWKKKDTYLFQVDVNHQFFRRTKHPERKARQTLKKLGFSKPQLVAHGEKCEFVVDGRTPTSLDIIIPNLPEISF